MPRDRTQGPVSLSVAVLCWILLSIPATSAERRFPGKEYAIFDGQSPDEALPFKHMFKTENSVWQPHKQEYHHIWPRMTLGWQIFIGSAIAFFGAAVGSVGGVGGGGIFVPMLTLIIGFDAKSSTAISKCMIMGAAGSTVYFNLMMRHPTLDLPIIDYDLAMLFQPMLMLGISIGVAFNVIFADWMVTVLLIILFLITSSKAFFKGISTWKQETLQKKEAVKLSAEMVRSEERVEEDFTPLSSEAKPNEGKNGKKNASKKWTRGTCNRVCLNVQWKELAMLLLVWFAFLAIQIAKMDTPTCSAMYWVLNVLQIPVAFSVSLYEAVSLYRGSKVIGSIGDAGVDWNVSRLSMHLFCGVLAGMVGGLLGLGGGFILGPLLLELGVPPQVSSATSTFVMLFSSSMSVVQYYLLKRFPVPYAAYFFAICFVAAFWGQLVIRRLIILLGRASLIIFTLASVIFLSALTLGGVGIMRTLHKIHEGGYMGFENLCTYKP